MNTTLRNVIALAKAEPRKAWTLMALCGLLTVSGGRAMLKLGPSAGRAAPPGGAADATSVVAEGQTAVSRALASIEAAQAGGMIRVPAAPRASRNIFALEDAHFPRPAQTAPIQPEAAESPMPVVESPAESADAVRTRKEAAVAESARLLILRSVVVGRNPVAVIEKTGGSRHLVGPGQEIEGFVLNEVGADWAVMTKDGVRVKLLLSVQDR